MWHKSLKVLALILIGLALAAFAYIGWQMWGTNVQAHHSQTTARHKLEKTWKTPAPVHTHAHKVTAPKPAPLKYGAVFAEISLPPRARVGSVWVPVAEGISKPKVLNHGYAGHYLHTARPGQVGNFAAAGHRNTHGEPFRQLDEVRVGDTVRVRTGSHHVIRYRVTKILPSTSPNNVHVLDPVPTQAGFHTAGRYITLTTCTPEFTSWHRLIVWGEETR